MDWISDHIGPMISISDSVKLWIKTYMFGAFARMKKNLQHNPDCVKN